MIDYIYIIIIGIIIIVFGGGIRIVRPTERAVKETLGKYSGFAKSGFNWVIPIIQRMVQVNMLIKLRNLKMLTKYNEAVFLLPTLKGLGIRKTRFI